MPRYTSGYFLEIFLEGNVANYKGEVDRYKKDVIEKLREMEKENPSIEIWPKIGVFNVILVTTEDSLTLSDWEKIKVKVKAIIEENKKEE